MEDLEFTMPMLHELPIPHELCGTTDCLRWRKLAQFSLWARIVLVVERGVPPNICLAQQRNYSQPMADGRRALVLRLEHSEDDKEELRCIAEMRTSNFESIARRKNNLDSKLQLQGTLPSNTLVSPTIKCAPKEAEKKF